LHLGLSIAIKELFFAHGTLIMKDSTPVAGGDAATPPAMF